MKIHNRMLRKNENGATAVYAAVVLALLLGFAALGVDINYLYGVRNELHNAADAGSLAGASMLFDEKSGDLTRDAAIAEATRIATANKTGNQTVVAGTVETGHWSFAEPDKSKKFTPSSATTQLEGWQEMSFSDLDGNPAFINAVRVQADRSDTPSFFAKILGFDDFFVSADAVAYIGFAGTLYPAEINQPIAICKEAITNPDGSYTCDKGRMINSGSDKLGSHNTGGWTNFTQEPSCQEPTPNDKIPEGVLPLICANGNPNELKFGVGMAVKGGEAQPAMKDIYDCWWKNSKDGTTSWNITLPVVQCGDDNNPHGCLDLVGAVNVDVIWIYDKNPPKGHDAVPTKMYDVPGYTNWDCPAGFKESQCWDNFAEHFDLANRNLVDKSIYFLPDCEVHEPTGNTGGENFGILAKIPVLVE